MSESLHDTIIQELSARTFTLSARIERIKNDIAFLSSEAVELNVYFTMLNKEPMFQLAKELNTCPKELNKMKRSCKLTHKSPHLNRALLSRFDIIP